MLADVEGECARIHTVDARYAVLGKVFIEALFAPPVAWRGEVADDKPRKKKGAAFRVRAIDSLVADFGGGEGDELPRVRWIRQYLLITAHAGIEDNLAERIFLRAERNAVKHRSVVQRQKRHPIPLRFPLLGIIHAFSLSKAKAHTMPIQILAGSGAMSYT